MPPPADLRLAVMTFPQRWDGTTLSLNVLLVPAVDPLLDPVVGQATAAFADRVPDLGVVVIPSFDTFPTTADPTALRPPLTLVEPPLPVAPRPAFERLAERATAEGVAIGPPPAPVGPYVQLKIRKALPSSYLALTGASPNGVTTTTTDDFGCEVRGEEPGKVVVPRPPRTTSWGALMSFALRQPKLAGLLGLRYELTFQPDPASFEDGGWVFVELAPADAWAQETAASPLQNVGAVRLFAARIPPLTAAPRPVFAAVLFPVDAVQALVGPSPVGEAETYDAGFARIVHVQQPTANDGALGDGSTIPAPTDVGVQIGWDDEQIVTWTNRQLGMLAARHARTLEAEAPVGVLGYRLDVVDITGRNPADVTPLAWESLMRVSTALPMGMGAFAGELCVEPSPLRLNEVTTDAWLPHYFATWRGGSVGVADDIPNRLLGHPPTPTANTPVPVATLLSYGRSYAFRVRLADLSSGGPQSGDEPVEPGTADTASLLFRRMVPAKSASVVVEPGSLRISRPVIGYPEVLFTGLGATAADRNAIVDHYLAHPAVVQPGGGAVAGVPDPDVERVRITVEVGAPAHDIAGPATELDGTYRVLYTTERALPVLPPGPTPADVALTVDLAFVDAPSIVDWAPAGWPDAGPLVVPRGRDLHIRVAPVLRNDPNYFGPSAHDCLSTTVAIRAESQAEPGLLVENQEGDEPVRGLLFRRPPGVNAPPVVAHLAQTLRLVANGLAVTAPPGQRVVFGASGGIRHALSGDGGTITFATESELSRHWIVPIVVDLARDWTWDGLDGPISVTRDNDTVGAITVPFVLSPQAGADPVHQDRTRTRLVFFDAVDPHEPTDSGFPEALPHTWTVTAPTKVDAGPAVGVAGNPTFVPGYLAEPPRPELGGTPLEVTLPIAVPPTQMPSIASVGIALSPFQAGDGYASTASRRRALWIELDEPVENGEGDTLFGRVIAHGSDPLLYQATPSMEQKAEPPLVMDPELCRIVVPDDSDDRAGIGAMVELERSTDGSHYLLPLPPGVEDDSPELFGFWTWELRVGHAGDPHAPGQRWWSTAQGRFGRPLRVNGVQHPPPELACRAGRVRRASPQEPLGDRILATATFATPVLDGRPLVSLATAPRTTMCFFLYAQVVQADGSTNRNVLLSHRYGEWTPPRREDRRKARDTQRDRIGRATFLDEEVERLLARLVLPSTSALSVLAVELLPGGTGDDVARHEPEEPPADAADPLGAALGPEGRPRRILRVSPLVPVAPAC